MVSPRKTKVMGLVKNMVQSPLKIIRACRRENSSMGPSKNPISRHTSEKPILRIR